MNKKIAIISAVTLGATCLAVGAIVGTNSLVISGRATIDNYVYSFTRSNSSIAILDDSDPTAISFRFSATTQTGFPLTTIDYDTVEESGSYLYAGEASYVTTDTSDGLISLSAPNNWSSNDYFINFEFAFFENVLFDNDNSYISYYCDTFYNEYHAYNRTEDMAFFTSSSETDNSYYSYIYRPSTHGSYGDRIIINEIHLEYLCGI